MNLSSSSQPIITPEKWLNGRKLVPELEGCQTAIAGFCRLNEMKNKLSAVPLSSSIFSHLDLAHQFAGVIHGKTILAVECLYGGPFSATVLEEMASYGIKKVIGYGYAGSLSQKFPIGQIVFAYSGLVSDGTSREYLPEQREVYPDPSLAGIFRRCAAAKGCGFQEAMAWTTDALYREYPQKIKRWREAGGEIVNMDTSYFYAICQVTGMAAVYACVISDCVEGAAWVEGFQDLRRSMRLLQDIIIDTTDQD